MWYLVKGLCEIHYDHVGLSVITIQTTLQDGEQTVIGGTQSSYQEKPVSPSMNRYDDIASGPSPRILKWSGGGQSECRRGGHERGYPPSFKGEKKLTYAASMCVFNAFWMSLDQNLEQAALAYP